MDVPKSNYSSKPLLTASNSSKACLKQFSVNEER